MYDDGFGTGLATLCPLCQGALPAWTFVCAGESSVGSGRGEGYADRWIRQGRRVMPSSAQPPRESPVSQLLGTLPAVGSGVRLVGGRGKHQTQARYWNRERKR